ncbi:hypothetical protein BV898_06668 [Hypsibius exemplaris]|uniref:Saposin B-type domain-containing protein n=1 Tax=Hypsibius exemplaris TaxID=2072580 RepID=A0A1W0WVL9_HYPEX|nr:hypothetical protein BV898_06668 [Hypsibius exemplaris]
MRNSTQLIFLSLFLSCALIPLITGKLHTFDEDEEEYKILLSAKKPKGKAPVKECSASDEKCSGLPVAKNIKPQLKKSKSQDMMDNTAEMMMDLFGNMPGANPLMAAALRVSGEFMKEAPRLRRVMKAKGISLKGVMDEVHDIFNTVIPGLVITMEHADRKCRRQALCRAAKSAGGNSHDFPKSIGMFLSYAAATYVDRVDKTKKQEYIKIVECCSSSDKGIYNKCSAKYLDTEDCSEERMLDPKMLQPIPPSEVELLLSFIPDFK